MVKLGNFYTDRITGFKGIATGRTEYLYGCVRVQLEPQGLKDGKPTESMWFDEQRLEVNSEAKSGGPMAAPPPVPNPK